MDHDGAYEEPIRLAAFATSVDRQCRSARRRMGRSWRGPCCTDGGVGLIVRAAADGSYLASSLDGQKGDRIEIQYQPRHGERSTSICRPLDVGTVHDECEKVDGGR